MACRRLEQPSGSSAAARVRNVDVPVLGTLGGFIRLYTAHAGGASSPDWCVLSRPCLENPNVTQGLRLARRVLDRVPRRKPPRRVGVRLGLRVGRTLYLKSGAPTALRPQTMMKRGPAIAAHAPANMNSRRER